MIIENLKKVKKFLKKGVFLVDNIKVIEYNGKVNVGNGVCH